MNHLIPKEHIQLGVFASDWHEAIRAAGGLLVKSGCIEQGYIDSMIDAVNELGPYMVLLPGFALAHAAPSPDVHRDAMSLITLASPVEFGSEENDPVRVVLCLSCVDRESHIASLRRVAMALMEDGMVDRLAGAKDAGEIQSLLVSE